MNDQVLNKIEDLEKWVKALENILNPSDDELLSKAEQIIKEYEAVSTSLLQRRLCIGYTRASRIMNILSSKGIVEEGSGIKIRKVIKKNYPSNNSNVIEPLEQKSQKLPKKSAGQIVLEAIRKIYPND